MSGPPQRTWARHFQDDWQARAGDPRMPYWLRVAALAYGNHADNGHARFKRGEVALILGSVNKESGEVRPLANVGREIDRTVEYGWLESGSYWGCLIVPAHSIRKGDLYATPAGCPLAPRHRDRAKRSVGDGFGDPCAAPTEPFKTQTHHVVSGSQRKPLLSVLSPQPTADPQARRTA